MTGEQGQPGPEGAWFNPLAAFLGPAYWAPGTTRVQAFTTGTEQEVDFLVEALGLAPRARVLDVGCGPGRHLLSLARRGFDVVGVDLSPVFVDLARASAAEAGLEARIEVGDVRALDHDREFDAVLSLCQGGFGLLGGHDDAAVLHRLAAALRPGGGLALSAFSSYFVVGALEPGEEFDAATGVHHEVVTVRSPEGEQRSFDAWTTCFTPRELALLATAAGLDVEAVHAVAPGDYAARPPDLEHPEHLLLARRPAGSARQRAPRTV